MKRSLSIDVYFDFICPWCLIGRRQLQAALAQFKAAQPEVEVNLAWQGVQLLPELPFDGQPFAEFYRRRLGSDQAVRQRQAQVRAASTLRHPQCPTNAHQQTAQPTHHRCAQADPHPLPSPTGGQPRKQHPPGRGDHPHTQEP